MSKKSRTKKEQIGNTQKNVAKASRASNRSRKGEKHKEQILHESVIKQKPPYVIKKWKWYAGIGLTMLLSLVINIGLISFFQNRVTKQEIVTAKPQEMYWFLLHRKSQKEYLYKGVPGDPNRSRLLKTFTVKVGIPGERPTPLPKLAGREYWRIIDKLEQFDNPETSPYFLTLDIPVPSEEPFGPSPYMECNGQCNWVLPGDFGLHGVASDSSRLSPENPGSSGCIRHTDEDITYLYHLLDPKKEEIRYYIEDR